jgi:uncharacterized protein YbjT (DUF2867 family)
LELWLYSSYAGNTSGTEESLGINIQLPINNHHDKKYKMKKTVAVLGATGQTGKLVVQRLLEQDVSVRVLSRSVPKAQKMFGSSVEIIEGDLVEVRDLKALVSGVAHLFAVHGADRFSGGRGYELVDFGGMDKALDSIPAEQKTHIIYMSSCVDYEHDPPPSSPFNQPLYWKRLTERMVQGSGHPYTIVRPGRLNNNKGGSLHIVAEQHDAGGGNISREDVAELMLQAMQHESAKGKVFEAYNIAVIPTNDWKRFFSELQTDVYAINKEGSS